MPLVLAEKLRFLSASLSSVNNVNGSFRFYFLVCTCLRITGKGNFENQQVFASIQITFASHFRKSIKLALNKK